MYGHFKLGLTTRRACDLARVSESVFNSLISIGKADEAAGKTKGRFLEFLVTMRLAQAEFRANHIKDLAANPDWRAKAWLLERIVPDEFGPKERRADEVDRPREGVIVDAVVSDPLHELLDEAKRQGS